MRPLIIICYFILTIVYFSLTGGRMLGTFHILVELFFLTIVLRWLLHSMNRSNLLSMCFRYVIWVSYARMVYTFICAFAYDPWIQEYTVYFNIGLIITFFVFLIHLLNKWFGKY